MTTLNQAIEPCKILKSHSGSKFQLGDKIYCFNIGMQKPLVHELTVKGIVNDQENDSVLYSDDKSAWIKEEFLFKTKKEAYRHLILQAETEMNQS